MLADAAPQPAKAKAAAAANRLNTVFLIRAFLSSRAAPGPFTHTRGRLANAQIVFSLALDKAGLMLRFKRMNANTEGKAGRGCRRVGREARGDTPCNLTAVIYPDAQSDWLVAYNPETGTTTQGKTFEEALANLKEATELYLSEFPLPRKGRPIMTTFEVSALAHA